MLRFVRTCFRQALSPRPQQAAVAPGRIVAFFALLAVILSSYPVVFLGRSYVSPNYGTPLLYGGFPTLPESEAGKTSAVMGSDVGALMWQHVPYAVVQSRALFRDREWPVWNRYNSGGVPLLGQGQTMFGDPLHWLVIAAKGSAWAWDCKFLAAKFLLALGLGLTVLALTRHVPAAVAITFTAPFFGFFIFRVNHPAIFSLCYAPWILYCWVCVNQARALRPVIMGMAGLVLASLSVMTSGTIKEAYILLVSLNLVGAWMVLLDDAPWRARWSKLAVAIGTGGCFAIMTMPLWRLFLDVLREARTTYDVPAANQLSPGLLLGAFDEALYRALSAHAWVFNPAATFLVLAGVLMFGVTWHVQRQRRAALALASATLVPFAFVYGYVPASWITRVPFLANVIHVDNTFSCVLLLLGSVLAGYGFAAAAKRLAGAEGRRDLVNAGAVLAALLALYVVAARWPTGRVGLDGEPLRLHFDRFVLGYTVVMIAALVGLGVTVRRALVRGRYTRGEAITLGCCVFALLWRHGVHAEAGFSHYTLRGAPRADFQAESVAITSIQEQLARAPARVVGTGYTLMGGWSAVYDLESITGPDALMNPAYRELLAVSPLRREWDWRFYLEPSDVERVRSFLDFLNVRFYLNPRGTPPAPGLVRKTPRLADLEIDESRTVWPRAYFTDRVQTYDTAAELVGRLHAGGTPVAGVCNSDAAAIAGTASLVNTTDPAPVVPAENYRCTASATAFDVVAPRPGIVVLTETYWPKHVQVVVDGDPRPVAPIRVNHAFQGILVGPGVHHLEFVYAPAGFRGYLWAASLAALALLLSSVVGWIYGDRVALGWRRRS